MSNLQNLESFARRNTDNGARLGNDEIGEGKYKYVLDGTYDNGECCAIKLLKSGTTFSSNCFDDDVTNANAALKYVAGFHDYIEKETPFKGRVSIKVNIPAVWEQTEGDLVGQKVLVEPYIDNFQKFNSNSGAQDLTAAVAQALSHYSYHASDGNEILCDLQGGKVGESYVLSDVVLMSKEKKYGNTDLGVTGIENWMHHHRCTQFCSSQWKKWTGARCLIIPTFSSSTTLETNTAPGVYNSLIRVRASAIRFTHDSISYHFQDGHTLLQTAIQIAREDVEHRDIRMINVVRVRDGTLYALDNRRLAVFRLLEMCGRVRTIKVEIVPLSTNTDEWNRKLTTTNDGAIIDIRGTNHYIGTTCSDTHFPSMNGIRNARVNAHTLSDERFSIFLAGFKDT